MRRFWKVITDLTRTFDLPADSKVPVIERKETGDMWHVRGGFLADLAVHEADGNVLSENHYDSNEEEVQTFLTPVNPLAVVPPRHRRKEDLYRSKMTVKSV